MVQLTQLIAACRSCWRVPSAVDTMVWSIDAMNRAMAVTPKIRKRRLGGGSPAGTEAGGAWVISPDVTTVYDTAYRQASIFASLRVPRRFRAGSAPVPRRFRAGSAAAPRRLLGGSSPMRVDDLAGIGAL